MRYALGDRLFFMHLPKTAGTTLKAYLADMYPFDRICPAFEHVELNKLTEAGQLSRFDLFQGHFTYQQLPQELKDRCRFLTVLRHPLPRVISEYYQWSRRPEIFTAEIKASLLKNHNAQTLMLSPLRQDEAGVTLADHLAAAKEVLEKYIFVGVQERFVECMQALALILKRPVPEDVPRLNVGRNKQAAVPGRSEDEILSSNWADLALHDYAHALFERKFKPPIRPAAGTYQSTERYTDPKPRGLHYRMDQPLIGSGWYEREGMGSEAPQLWRWTGPGQESYVDLALDTSRNYRVSVRILNAVSPEVLRGLRLYVNAQEVVLTEHVRKWWQPTNSAPTLGGWLFKGRLRAAQLQATQGFVRVTLQVPRTIKQCEADPNATLDRPCGLAVTEINFD
jgi:hypothetical protein